jgi:hypothetical protein
MPSTSTRALAPAIALAIALGALPGARAQQRPPVEMTVAGVFGPDALLGDGYSSIAITARNLSRETFRGRVVITATEHGQPPSRHVLSLDLPGGQTRQAVMTIFLGGSGTSLSARYEADGRTLGLAEAGTTYAPAAQSLVMLVEASRMRAALLDLQVSIPNPTPAYGYGSAGGAEQAVAVPLGVASFDPATADPILPPDALGWSTVAVAVVSIPLLARAPERELGALRDWVHAGGHLVLSPRTAADLGSPLVREMFGEVSARTDRALTPGELVPWEPSIPALACGDRAASEERFGCAATVGHGLAYLLAFDATGAQHVDTPQVRSLMRSIAQRALRDDGPQLAFGRERDSFQDSGYYYGAPPRSFARLRAALDPNEGYRPALGLVAIVLIFYVIVVGPLNFRFVLARNVPTLALVTTPIAAAGCALLMLGVGYLGKGVEMRYRRVEIVQASEGDALAPARGYAGYFLTRPSTVDLAGLPRGATMRLTTGGDDGLVIDHGGERPRLGGLRGGLWETVFFRDDRVVDLGGGISFTFAARTDGPGERLAAVTNGGTVALRSAFVLDEGLAYAIGDVEPGATRPIAQDAAATGTPISFTTGYYDDPTDGVPAQLATLLGLGEEHVPYVAGIVRLVGAPSDPTMPVLWARMDPGDARTTSPGFAEEEDLRVLVLAMRHHYDLLGVAPAPSTAGMMGDPGVVEPLVEPTELPDPAEPNGEVP